jgi:hypothetical protein
MVHAILVFARSTILTFYYNNCCYRIVSLTQELGRIEAAPGHTIDFNAIPVGSHLRILPYHVCAAYRLYVSSLLVSAHFCSSKLPSAWRCGILS